MNTRVEQSISEIGCYNEFAPFVQAIEQELNHIPQREEADLNNNAAKVSLEQACKFKRGWENELRYAGLNLVHAKAITGMLPGIIETAHGWLIPDEYGWLDQEFAQLAIDEYYQGAQLAKSIVPNEVQAMSREFSPQWFETRFQTTHTAKAFERLLAPKAMFAPMDHFTVKRSFWGAQMHYPEGLDVPLFDILKVTAMPLTFYSSNRPENDFKSYVYQNAKDFAMSPATLLRENGAHETTHILAVEPIVHAIANGPSHSWLTEGLVILLSEKEGYRFRLRKDVGANPLIQKITTGKSVNYGESFLFVATLAHKLGKSDIRQGTIELVRRLYARAKAIQKGEAVKADDYSNLHLLIEPNLADPRELIRTEKQMLELKNLLLEGKLDI